MCCTITKYFCNMPELPKFLMKNKISNHSLGEELKKN